MKAWSWFLISFITILPVFVGWTRGNPYDIGGALARELPKLLIAFVIAYLIRGRKNKRNWDSFAQWYFWLALGLMVLSEIQRV